jgi:hypothetical protein
MTKDIRGAARCRSCARTSKQPATTSAQLAAIGSFAVREFGRALADAGANGACAVQQKGWRKRGSEARRARDRRRYPRAAANAARAADRRTGRGQDHTTDRGNPSNLFRLENGIEIEVKRFHTDRVGAQLARAENVILAQGAEAVAFLAELLRKASK